MDNVNRLEYIGSKFKLLEWIFSCMKIEEKSNISFADLYSGTGVVSYYARINSNISKVISNDRELYSYVISRAMNSGTINNEIASMINEINTDFRDNKYLEAEGTITREYSEFNGNHRKFFTIDNAKRIDYSLDKLYRNEELNEEDKNFILASIIISADKISNVPAVYGCYLKNYKKKAVDEFQLYPIHQNNTSVETNETYQYDILNDILFNHLNEIDIVYLDPPYNQRQYSKNYFPLNIIAQYGILPENVSLRGKTGIPSDSFVSSFCKKREVNGSFMELFGKLKSAGVKKVFLSYNSESLISREDMIVLLTPFKKDETEIIIHSRDYKRFKNFRYNGNKNIQEYLFEINLN
jgi:adenine-specific DNA-methyltransferase